MQFEDKFELRIELNNHLIAGGVSHFSNANLASENDGVNIWYLSYSYILSGS